MHDHPTFGGIGTCLALLTAAVIDYRMRARRNQVEYASSSNPAMTKDEVLADAEKASALVDLAVQVLPGVDEF